MDTVSDKEVESIWNRVKTYIDTSSLKSKEPQTLKQELNLLLSASREPPSRSGSIQTLKDKGFSDRVVELGLPQKEVREDVIVRKMEIVAKRRIKTKNINVRENDVLIRKKGRTRRFSRKTLKITESTWRNKPAVYIYSLRQKKLVTWGLIQ